MRWGGIEWRRVAIATLIGFVLAVILSRLT